MKNLYIADKKIWEQHALSIGESHWIPTDDPDKILVVCDIWEAEGVETLPHPFAEATQPIADHHADILKGLGIQRGHTVTDVIREAGKIHPHFKHNRVY